MCRMMRTSRRARTRAVSGLPESSSLASSFWHGVSAERAANEENNFNINDLWVSAAVAQDIAVFEDDDAAAEDEVDENLDDTQDDELYSPDASPLASHDAPSRQFISRSRLVSGGPMSSVYRSMPSHRFSTTSRRFSTASGALPSIFANTGLTSPPALVQAYEDQSGGESVDPFFPSAAARGPMTNLSAIAERPGTTASIGETSPLVSPIAEMAVEKPKSSFKLLPLLMISQVCSLFRHPCSG